MYICVCVYITDISSLNISVVYIHKYVSHSCNIVQEPL